MPGKTWFTKQGLRNAIPGTTGKRIPGAESAKLPRMVGAMVTRVPTQATASLFREANRQQIRDSRGQFAGGFGYSWQGLAAMAANFTEYMDEFDNNVERAAHKLADDMLEYAKANAIWIDHPGEHEDARQNLQSAVVNNGNGSYSVFLGHGRNVYYGVWLETRWGGKYAIIVPTIYKFAPDIGTRIQTQT